MKSSTSFMVGVGIVALLGFGGFRLLSKATSSVASRPVADGSNVAMVDGKQIVTIKTRGGYQPELSKVRAGVPTVLRFETKGTFDCSSVISIPSLDISMVLPATGSTDVEVGTLSVGTLNGSCGMGMYRFAVTSEAGV